MDMPQAIARVVERRDLDGEEMRAVMGLIMSGQASPAQIGGFLVGLRMKGETIEEIAAAAGVMRELATPVEIDVPYLVDTCGTGGDRSGTFNVSTASAFVVAAAGGHVAKHGNRSVSSRSGSADLLEAAGVRIDLKPGDVARCVETVGVGFMFAPLHHGAMKHAIGPRREMGVRTIFNVLGPLTNPARAPNQVIGVFDDALVEPIARVMQRLGSRHVLVVHAGDGMDEISVCAPTRFAELSDGQVRCGTLEPGQFGMALAAPDALVARDAAHSLAIIEGAFAGTPGPAADIIALNAGAAIYVAGLAPDIGAGVARAREVLASGKAAACLRALVEFSRSIA